VFSVGNHIRDWKLLRDIILLCLFGLFMILVYPKGILLWPLVGTEKVGMRSAGLNGYSVGFHLYIFHFDIFTGYGHLTLG
jgi:sterol desaturase/sphingolipid hydroxylase (fatty acid hydroxylase superfamily)